MNPLKDKILREIVEELERKNIIRKSESDWNSPALVIPKANGKHRLVIAYNYINELFVKEITPPPLITEVIDNLREAKYFTTIDLTDGYYQITLHPNSRKITAFTAGKIKYEFNRLSQGLVNAPSIFQKIMNCILNEEIGTFTTCYMDDILIYSETKEDHLLHLEKIFKN
ncbi:POLY [Hepatospora eriocheir]|uniref:POLY n=1 Tax=Hepatospora eriocheir TaxID=1081669 RepID=A0A1X0Q953_9MICR|nr:POLY [Hepatospora eriocheir]